MGYDFGLQQFADLLLKSITNKQKYKQKYECIVIKSEQVEPDIKKHLEGIVRTKIKQENSNKDSQENSNKDSQDNVNNILDGKDFAGLAQGFLPKMRLPPVPPVRLSPMRNSRDTGISDKAYLAQGVSRPLRQLSEAYGVETSCAEGSSSEEKTISLSLSPSEGLKVKHTDGDITTKDWLSTAKDVQELTERLNIVFSWQENKDFNFCFDELSSEYAKKLATSELKQDQQVALTVFSGMCTLILSYMLQFSLLSLLFGAVFTIGTYLYGKYYFEDTSNIYESNELVGDTGMRISARTKQRVVYAKSFALY